jgi:hypothetical protein
LAIFLITFDNQEIVRTLKVPWLIVRSAREHKELPLIDVVKLGIWLAEREERREL